MIATILPSSTDFHAVEYNERKVAKGVAELIEIRNFGYVGMCGPHTPQQLKQYLLDYSAQNTHIRKAQFHAAISCKGHEYTQEQLLDIAHQYLKEMGYANEGQPLLVYAHRDTENNHLHIITSRVAPDGHKIDHNHERIRSQEAINKIVGEDEQLRAELYLKEALDYRFESLTQFRAILQSSGYDSFEKDNELHLARGGHTWASTSLPQITALFRTPNSDDDGKRRRQLRAIIKKYSNMASSRAELSDMLKRKFGVDLVFFGANDNPYGYMVIDQSRKTVYRGGTVLSIKHLKHFMSDEERLAKISLFVDAMLEEQPRMIAYELNRMLWRQFGAHISKGCFMLPKGRKVQLSESVKQTLKFNYMLRCIGQFHPTTTTERNLLCCIWKINDPDLIAIQPDGCNHIMPTLNLLKDLIAHKEEVDVKAVLKENHIGIFKVEDQHYCVGFNTHTIFCLEENSIDIRQLFAKKQGYINHVTPQHAVSHAATSSNAITYLLGQRSVSKNRNAEWEVGGHYDDEMDDERKLKR